MRGKIIPVAKSVKVIDTVAYQNIAVNEEFTLRGVLMDKETGKPILVDGKEVTAETTFVAKAPSGNVDMVFTFDTTGMQDKILVVFETLIHTKTEKEIAAHKDINDDAQTVGVGVEVLKDGQTTGQGAKTGRDGLPLLLLIVAIGAGATATLLVKRKKAISNKGKAADNE